MRRFQAWLLALFSMLAVLLAAVGIFGLMAQVVTRRTPEIGVRMALGATPADVLRLVVLQGVLLLQSVDLSGWPALCFLPAPFAVCSSVSALATPELCGAAAVMTVSVLVACALPAWRAARIDPTLALRREA